MEISHNITHPLVKWIYKWHKWNIQKKHQHQKENPPSAPFCDFSSPMFFFSFLPEYCPAIPGRWSYLPELKKGGLVGCFQSNLSKESTLKRTNYLIHLMLSGCGHVSRWSNSATAIREPQTALAHPKNRNFFHQVSIVWIQIDLVISNLNHFNILTYWHIDTVNIITWIPKTSSENRMIPQNTLWVVSISPKPSRPHGHQKHPPYQFRFTSKRARVSKISMNSGGPVRSGKMSSVKVDGSMMVTIYRFV